MQKRKLTAALISGLLAAQSLASTMPIAAAGESAGGMLPADAVRKDPDAVKFRNDEWKGNDYTAEDGSTKNTVDIFQVGREDASALTVPYQDDQSASNSVWNYNDREKSDYLQMLTGEGEDRTWQLNVVTNPAEAAQFEGENGFTNKDFSNEAWKDVTLPCSWTMQGFDFSIYTNQTMPWQTKYGDNTSPNLAPAAPTNYNPVGMYRKSFTLKDGMLESNRRVYINFQGVESAYYVYVNGKEVGYSEDTFSPHKFDITEYLQEGENFLAVKVLKYSDAVWMEDQDMIYDGGIFRDVFLTSAPLVQISDYKVETDLDAQYKNAVLSVDMDIRNLSKTDISGWTVDMSAFDEEGNDLLAGVDTSRLLDAKAASETSLRVAALAKNPKLWSCEDPNLYALVLRIKDAKGNVVETLSTQLGFREIEYTHTQVDEEGYTTTSKWDPILLNGKKLFLKGADRHDTDPVYGKATPQKTIEADLSLMKQNNLNAIRTSHYSNDDYLYWLANRWGVYILAETNVECHAFMGDGRFSNSYTGIASDYKAKFRDMILDREETAFERLKNNPSVVIWSLGNETARPYILDDGDGVFKDAMQYFKDEDDTRPVLFESFGSNMGGDIHCEQYPSVEGVQSWAGSGRIPYLMSEFAHAMGNSAGNLKEYLDAVRSEDNMVGCFIWDWVDQSRYKSLSDLSSGWTLHDSKNNVAGQVTGDKTDLKTGLDSADTLNNGTSFSGSTVMDQSDIVDAAISGANKSFTLEVNVKPTANGNDNVFITKGDNQVSLKTNKSNQIEFFVYDSSWRAVTWPIPTDWVGTWHHLAVTYDQGTINLYLDGEKYGDTKTVSNVTINNSSYKLGIGAETQNGRRVDGEISVARIYSRALSAEEVQGQMSASPAITKDDESVVLWVDYASGLTDNASEFWDYYSLDNAKSGIYKEEAKGNFLAYGGDWGDRPNDDSFCANGLVSADRTPQPELNEAKFQYQNLWFEATDEQVAARKVSVYNENRFANLNDYDLVWEVLEDGKVAKTGTIPAVDVEGLETAEITVPYEMPEVKEGCEYLLNVSARLKEKTEWADAGHELSYAQFVIPANVSQKAYTASSEGLTISGDDEKFSVSGNGFSFEISKTTGQLSNYVFNGETLIKEGPKPNFWRCLTENDEREGDNFFDHDWRTAGDSITVTDIAQSEEDGASVITVKATLPNAENAKFDMIYKIDNTGAVTMNVKADATATSMGNYIVVGTQMKVPGAYENVSWYADGPDETLADRMTSARATVFSKTVTENFYPYIKVDDTGTYPETRWMRLSGSNATDLMVIAKDTVQTSALHFEPTQMNNADHPYELKPLEDTVVGINYGSKGTGGATCGAGTRSPYLMPNQVYEWEFTLKPIAKTASQSEADDAFHSFHTANVVTVDENADPALDAFVEDLDAFFAVDYNQKADAEAIKAAYDVLSAEQKAKLSAEQRAKAESIVSDVEALENKKAYLEDKSANHLRVDLDDSMNFLYTNGKGAFTGHVSLANQDVIAPVFSDGNSWTAEAQIVPTGVGHRETILSKGDYLFTLRTETDSLCLHISDGSNWYQTQTPTFTAEQKANWIGKLHTVTAVYDYTGGTLSIYLDGDLFTSLNTGQKHISDSRNQESPLSIGIDPLNTDRTASHQFVSARLYNKALTADEIKKTAEGSEGALTPESDSVVLWLDSENVKFENAPAADKTALQAEVTADDALEADGYTAESFAELTKALDAAKAVLAKADASQYAVNDALSALQAAKAALAEKVDLSQIEDLLKDAPGGTGYDADAWTAYVAASNEAKNMNVQSSAAEVAAAAQALQAAKAGLFKVDTTQLELAAAKADDIVKAAADYASVPESFASLADEVAPIVEAAKTTNSVSQKDVNDKASAVNADLLGLRLIPSKSKLEAL